jgi:hypothetical protein
VDNILVAFEMLNSLKNYTGKGPGQMALKLDMTKANDRVEWCFLEGMMRKMGFCDSWVRLIMGCITSVQYSVVVNGSSQGQIIPTHGLR